MNIVYNDLENAARYRPHVTIQGNGGEMALTRRMLKALSIEDDKIEQIIEAHTETLESIKAERDRLKAEAESTEGLEGQVEELKKKLKEATDGESEELRQLQAKYDEQTKELAEAVAAKDKTEAEFAEYKGDVEAKETERAKQGAFRKMLEESGFASKYADVIVRATQLGDIELGEDGDIQGREELEEKVKKQWPEFLTVKETRGANPEQPPKPTDTPTGANPIAVQIARERHERLYGKSEE